MVKSSRVPVNAVLLSSSQLARTIIGFLFFLFLARWLEPADFGRYMFAFALSEIFSILGDMGIHEYFIREMARKPKLLKKRLAGIIGLKTALSSTSAAIMIAIVPLMGKDTGTSLAVAAFALAQIGYSWFYASTIAWSARQDLHLQAIIWFLEKALIAGAGVAVLLAGYGFAAVALSNTAVQVAGGLLAVAIVWRKYGPLNLALEPRRWAGYLKAALPFGLIVAFYLVYFRIDSVMLSFIRGDADVGQYNAAYNLVAALMFIPAGLVAALFPVLAGSYRSPEDDLDAPFQKTFKLLLALSLPMAVGLWLLSGQLIAPLLGEIYLPAASPLAVLAWVLPVWFITFLQGNMLTVIERQKAVATVGFVNMAANVALNLLIIPRYGFTGAAATTLATEALGLMQMFYLLRRNISLTRTVSTAITLVPPAAVMGVLVWLLRDRLPVAAVIAMAAVIYGAIVVSLKIITIAEIRAVWRRKTEPAEPISPAL